MKSEEENAIETEELFPEILPLKLIRSQQIPPSPNTSESAIDWLHDFSGFSWIAYGAASLLVISHSPSPLTHEETAIGSFFRQVIDLPCSCKESAIIGAVAWSPSRPSHGDLAVGVDNLMYLFSASSENVPGSFCWKQTERLIQASKVEAIKWSGSGDGLIAAGLEVVIWKKKERSWEIAWKSRMELPQTLVSATWSIEGPIATAARVLLDSGGLNHEESTSMSREASRRVLIFHGDAKSGFVTVELCHPQPILIIQWRPLTRLKKVALHSRRDVLLTGCLDGAVRLWSEIDSGRSRKSGKDTNDQKAMKRSFHVISVIETSQSLKGNPGSEIYVTWAVEIGSKIAKAEGVEQWVSTEASECDTVSRCEWLIGVGPGMSLAFWAVHCLDEIFPLRFPRVTLWKKHDLLDFTAGHLCNVGYSNNKNRPIFVKAVFSRSQPFSTPTTCSLLQLLPDYSFSWLHLYSPKSNNVEDGSLNQPSKEKSLACFTGGFLSMDGHCGNILQVDVHPYSCEVEVAVSLDSNGLVLFWSLPTISGCISGMPMVDHPTWKLLGKIVSQDLSMRVEYSCLRWAPSVLNENLLLLMGHAGGIDCFIVKISEIEGSKILCHKICTIPFTDYSHGDGPDEIFAMSLPSTCRQTFFSNHFMLLGIWMKEFCALSWEIICHSDDLSGSSCGCSFNAENLSTSKSWSSESTFDGEKYCVIVNPCSSKLPDSHNCDLVTSVAVVCPDRRMPAVQLKRASSNGLWSNSSAYHMATGCFDGSLKLWRITSGELSTTHSYLVELRWELVGMFTGHQGPVSVISLSSCGGKIATISMGSQDSVNHLHIWESACLISTGIFLLVDKISLDGAVIALEWLEIGNGQLLLGVCMKNELRVYAQKRCVGEISVSSGKSSEMHIWSCIAFGHTFPAARDFLWGPGATPVIVHERYFSLFSQWSFGTDRKHQAKFYPKFPQVIPADCTGEIDEGRDCAIYTDSSICNIKEPSIYEKSEACESMISVDVNTKNDNGICNVCLTMSQHQYHSGANSRLYSMLEIAEKLCGSLSIYHPKALFLCLSSGNWKRAYVALRHLTRHLNSKDSSVTCGRGHNIGKYNYIIPQIDLTECYEEIFSTNTWDKGLQWDGDIALRSSSQSHIRLFQFVDGNSVDNSPENVCAATLGKSDISGFITTLETSRDIATITNTQRSQLLAIVDLLGEVSGSCYASAYESFDEPGRRFWVAVRFLQLNFSRKFGRMAAAEELVIDSGLMAWAFQSDCQDSLLSSVLSNEPSWMEMRNLGVGYWFTSATQLRSRMEKLARLQYLKKGDPKDCALLYLALNRLQVLAGLFKISKAEKDKPLVGFLSRNFQEEKNKAAALKNAYVLMGRHQLELAIAFFLLGGDPSSAVTVCAKNLGDEQLALVICRLIEGYGGALEHDLILNILLPAATEKGDYWLASLLEWVLGNYSQSFMHLLGFQMDAAMNLSAIPCKYAAFSDPNIGQYCMVLAAKTSVKNSIGEGTAAMLARWATLTTTSALNRCGLPLEALECLSSTSSMFCRKDQGSLSDIGKSSSLNGILKPSPSNASNWLLGDVACCLESNAKLNLAMQYIAKLLTEHPSWPEANLTSSGALAWSEMDEICQDELLVEKFEHKLHTGLSVFEHKYSLNSFDLINKILTFTSNNGLLFLGYCMLHGYTSRQHPRDKQHTADNFVLYPGVPKLFLKAIKEVTYLLARYVVACSIPCSALKPTFTEGNVSCENRYWDFYFQRIIYSMRSLRPFVQLYGSVFCTEDLTVKTFRALDLLQFCVHFASTWLARNTKGLILMIQPILNAFGDGLTFSRIKEADLKKSIYQTVELMFNETSNVCGGNLSASTCKEWKHEDNGSTLLSEDERWQLMSTSLWRHLYSISNNQFGGSIPEDGSSSMPLSSVSSLSSSSENCKPNGNSALELIKLLPVLLDKLLISTLTYISSALAKQLASFLRQKVEMGLPVPILVWLEESSQSQTKDISKCLNQGIDILKLINNDSGLSAFEILWKVSANPTVIRESFVEEKISCFQPISQKLSNGWKDIQSCVMAEYENGDDQESGIKSGSDSSLAGSPIRNRNPNSNSFLTSGQKHMSALREVSFFQNPKEIYKTNGELLEALCINSIDQQQVAVATNRKGILFFNLKAEDPYRDQAEYIWSESNWPQNGWAGSESTPVPTFVSPGVGLGSKKGAHLGLGGATIGLGSLARPGRDMTGGGAFGIPGYAGIGASGLGWGEQEDFEEFVDPPATIESIRTRTLSSHPSRPFFLVGSSNTHVYLWEFGKDRATATYGVLPAANVPPPYALASISALQFDHCGQRFATAALDGTVCTWQLEVGGRSNVRPTESSLCFNSHASDVAFVSASGSILAAAGHSPNGVNVIIWDTLAPPVTSQASLVCHEGGARSLSVFDNYIGSTSISPLIVTGGKCGDVGLHDFRYIATGKTKRHKHSTEQNTKSSRTDVVPSGASNKFGEQNQNGMLWYIPKAHQGSVTRISTVPNTSLFLTGSKDGDVKLWDAKRSELVFHWHKVHEKHTFLQPSSRGFGGLVRVAVTDIQVLTHGFLTCGGDGVVRQVQISDLLHGI